MCDAKEGAENEGITVQPGGTFNMKSEHALLQVVTGHGLIRCPSGRAEFTVHPGDQVVVPASSDYVVINSGSEALHLKPVHKNGQNDTVNSKNSTRY